MDAAPTVFASTKSACSPQCLLKHRHSFPLMRPIRTFFVHRPKQDVVVAILGKMSCSTVLTANLFLHNSKRCRKRRSRHLRTLIIHPPMAVLLISTIGFHLLFNTMHPTIK